MLSWNRAQVNITELHHQHRAKQSVVSKTGGIDDLRESGNIVKPTIKPSFDSLCQSLNLSSF